MRAFLLRLCCELFLFDSEQFVPVTIAPCSNEAAQLELAYLRLRLFDISWRIFGRGPWVLGVAFGVKTLVYIAHHRIGCR